MTLIGPFVLDIDPDSTTSSFVSASVFDAAESITLFASDSIEGGRAKLQGTLDLGIAAPHFRTLTVPGGDPIEQTGSQIAVGVNQAVVVDPVPAVAGFRVVIDIIAIDTNSFSLVGRTAPFTSGTIVVENTASVLIENTASVLIENTASVIVENTASVTLDAQPILVTGSVEVVAEPAAVTRSVTIDGQPVNVTGSVAIVNTPLDVETQAPFIITGSVEVVAEPAAVTRSVTLDAQPILVTGSMELVGQPIDVSGSVVISDLSQTEPILVTGSVFTAATVGATQSVSLVDSRVTQSVDLVFGDTVNVTNTQSIVIQGRAAPDTSAGTSPGGVPLRTFAALGSTSSL